MSFSRPELLALALLALPELFVGLRRLPRLRASLASLAGPRRRAAATRRFAALSRLGTAAGAIFIVAAALALAGPYWGARGSAAERRGLEAAIALDVSRSMEARDMGGGATRLEAAKALVSGLLRARGEGSAAFALVAAKGAAVLLAPMTEDRYALEDALAYANPDSISSPGTDLESGLAAAFSSFSASGAQGRVVFLFTDGGELSGSAARACEAAAAARARLVVVGMGGTKPVRVPGPDGSPLAGERGPVLSALNERELEALAEAAGGRYLRAGERGTEAALAGELASSSGAGMRIEYERVDRSGPFALAALAFLIAAIVAAMLAPREARS